MAEFSFVLAGCPTWSQWWDKRTHGKLRAVKHVLGGRDSASALCVVNSSFKSCETGAITALVLQMGKLRRRGVKLLDHSRMPMRGAAGAWLAPSWNSTPGT